MYFSHAQLHFLDFKLNPLIITIPQMRWKQYIQMLVAQQGGKRLEVEGLHHINDEILVTYSSELNFQFLKTLKQHKETMFIKIIVGSRTLLMRGRFESDRRFDNSFSFRFKLDAFCEKFAGERKFYINWLTSTIA